MPSIELAGCESVLQFRSAATPWGGRRTVVQRPRSPNAFGPTSREMPSGAIGRQLLQLFGCVRRRFSGKRTLAVPDPSHREQKCSWVETPPRVSLCLLGALPLEGSGSLTTKQRVKSQIPIPPVWFGGNEACSHVAGTDGHTCRRQSEFCRKAGKTLSKGRNTQFENVLQSRRSLNPTGAVGSNQ